jgi:DNA-binding CsgD family transcriptional regulator
MATTKSIKARDGRGRAIRTLETIERDRYAAELRSRSKTYQAIADELGIDVATAFRAVQRGMEVTPSEDQHKARRLELAKLDRIEDHLLKVMQCEHVSVSQGRVAMLDDSPVRDDSTGIQAALALLRVQDRRSKLLGLDEPTKTQTDVFTHDAFVEAFQQLEREVQEQESAAEKSQTDA